MVQVIHGAQNDDFSKKGAKLDEQLQKIKTASIEEDASRLASEAGLAYADLHLFPILAEDIRLIPEETATEFKIALFQQSGKTAHFAILDPANKSAVSYIKELCDKNGWKPTLHVISNPSLEKALAIYHDAPLIKSLDLMRVSLTGADLENFEKNFGILLDLENTLQKVSTSQVIETILAGAKQMRASDIHLEAEESVTRLRYRIDGVLQDIGKFPKSVYHLATSRIKMLGKMRLNIRDRAQDGHFFIDLDGKRIDIRVNSIPGKYGENINMRLLSADSLVAKVENLGLRGLAYEAVRAEIAKPHGMILNTGPTGSGKTTTLYTLLGQMNQPGNKIITIEDPIEYTLSGIVQTEVAKGGQYTFADGLRAIVRQDPDVILVGEIRDEETAEIAVNAALTGHLVLSTLHANSASAAVPRLLELGMKRDLITSSVNCFIAQRLVRILCDDCKTSYAPAKETVDSLKELIAIISPKSKVDIPKDIPLLWKSTGCQKCNMTGFRGRKGIFEVLLMSPAVTAVINDLGNEDEILRVALEDGMVTMTQDGILKAIEGTTTLEEVWRVADQADILRSIYSELMPSALSRSSLIPTTLLKKTQSHLANFTEFANFTKDLPQNEFLRSIFAAALLLRAGDIHLEPTDTEVLVRFRIDGILQTVTTFPKNNYPAILGEVKLWAGLKSGEQAGVVDGRFSISIEEPYENIKNVQTDIRLSIILGGFGETSVMRLLSKNAVKLELSSLNIRKENLARIMEAVKKPNGMILNTGPTGSGKTTTLYSILSGLNKPEVKIITVEDPIEYQMPGILQTQVNNEQNYSFALALRALLRQNPDIMMIGEIRDEETAQIAVQAAITGHLVLSTLHANSAAGAIPRMINMGVTGDDMANAGNCFIAQRLVRHLCENCREAVAPSAEEATLIERYLSKITPASGIEKPSIEKIYKAKGCEKCNGTGYTGQIVLSEALTVDQSIEELIARNALASEIEAKAIENGMVSLAQDGILSALEGRTTLEEVMRVTEE
ncbi:MAG: type II/IV secretion system protein [Candidatus Moranbacteria bacterium]|nr:type II/IV secretion system protein [Candidatus Moranbacteria bacterium]